MNVALTYDATVRLVAAIAGSGVVIAAVQDLLRSRVFADPGLLSWRVSRLRRPWSASGLRGKALDTLLAFPRVRAVLWCRAAAALLTVAGAVAGLQPTLLWLTIALSYAVMFLRNAEGHDGAEQMYFLVFLALAFAGLQPTGSPVARYCLWFIAAQAVSAYVVAGIHKVRSPSWRDGTALVGILGTSSYGSAGAYRLLHRRPQLSRCGCWAVIVLECAFPAVLVVDLPLAVVILGAGLLFHASTAALMGLNGFLPAFASTYPAVLYTVQSVG